MNIKDLLVNIDGINCQMDSYSITLELNTIMLLDLEISANNYQNQELYDYIRLNFDDISSKFIKGSAPSYSSLFIENSSPFQVNFDGNRLACLKTGINVQTSGFIIRIKGAIAP